MGQSLDPTYPLFPIFAFLGFVLSLLPLLWHVQAWNSGTCAFMIWTALSCFVGFVNSVVWSGNLDNPAPVWCDISSKIMIGVSVGLPASILCISRRLYHITSGTANSMTYNGKRRMVLVDVCIAAGIPLIVMILHYVVQGHRFDILEDIGCYPVVYNTLPAYFIYFMWPVLLGVVSFCYSAMTLRSFWIHRVQFSQIISTNTSMSLSRYLRLVMLAIIDITCTTPLAVYTIYIGNASVGLAPWISWEETHYNFSYVGRIPALIWRPDAAFRTPVELTRWLPVLCAFLFFILFGFASEARRFYQKTFQALLNVFVVPSDVKGLAIWNKPSKPSIVSTKTPNSPPVYTIKRLDSPTSIEKPIKSHNCTFSISTRTLSHAGTDIEVSPLSKKTFDLEKNAASSPSSPTSSTHPTLIGQVIDIKRNADERKSDSTLALPEIDESDAFTISSFSYYEGSTDTPLPPTATTVTPSTPPHPPSPRFLPPQHSLPPPPTRKQPRAIGSLSSLLSGHAETGRFSRDSFSFHNHRHPYRQSNPFVRSPLQLKTWPCTSTPVSPFDDLTQDVPEDVGPSSYTRPSGVLDDLPERDELNSHYVPLTRKKSLLGIEGGIVQVVVERSASVDSDSMV